MVFDNEAGGEEAVIGARLKHEQAEALKLEMVNTAYAETELEEDDDPEDVRDECDRRYTIIELGA